VHESFSDEPEIVAGVPDPLDRVWRHPSELAAAPAARAAAARPSLGVLFGLGVACAMVGSLLTVGILAMSGLVHGNPKPTAKDRLLVASTDNARTLAAARVTPSIVAISGTSGAAPRHGAGICIRHDGMILTAAWVTGKDRTVRVTQADGTELDGTVLGTDPVSGLAMVRVDDELPAASLADRAPGPSQTVIVIGTDHTIGEGIVNTTSTVSDARSGLDLPAVIVTDATPRLAAAGSALVDRFGKVAGVVLPNALGAVPIEYARAVADRIEAGTLQHAWIGLHARDTVDGPVVAGLDDPSPAAAAGIRVGAHIVAIDGQRITSARDVRAHTHARWIGDTVVVTVLDHGIERDHTLTALSLTPAGSPTAPAASAAAG
jgi:S1-C subfamily serine protease